MGCSDKQLMKIDANKNGKLVELKPKAFRVERDILQLFEENLHTLMDLTLVRSECTIKNKRIVMLALGNQACSLMFEHERDKNISVVTKAFTTEQ
jgi:hypothetical protein